MKHYLTIILAAILLAPAKASAQDTDSTNVVQSFNEQLAAMKAQQDKQLQQLSRNTTIRRLNADYHKLFTPITFYHDVASTLFDINRNSDNADDADALHYIYIFRPDLVLSTQKELDNSGSIIKQKDTKEKANTEPIINDKAIGLDVNPDVPDIDIVVKKPNFWKYSASLAMNFQQFKFSKNWYQGGQDYYSQVTHLILKANYNNKKKFSWSNTLEVRYDSQHNPADTVHSVRATNQYVRYNGNVGYVAFKKWNYSMGIYAETPIMQQFNANSKVVTTDFMSPLRLSISPGLTNKFSFWKAKFTGDIQISPISWSYIYCDRKNLATRFGIKKDKQHNITKGSKVEVNWTLTPFKNFSWTGKGWIYGPQYERTEIQIENTFSYRLNTYFNISTLVFLRYDDTRKPDRELGYWQYRENLVFSMNYSF